MIVKDKTVSLCNQLNFPINIMQKQEVSKNLNNQKAYLGTHTADFFRMGNQHNYFKSNILFFFFFWGGGEGWGGVVSIVPTLSLTPHTTPSMCHFPGVQYLLCLI